MDAAGLTARDVIESMREGAIITDLDGTIRMINGAFTRLTGYRPEEAVGMNPRILHSGRHGADFYRALWGAIRRNGYWEGEIWNRRKSGEVYPEWLTISAVKGGRRRPSHYLGVFTDISSRKRRERLLEHSAKHDPLTGLPNSVLLRDRLDQILARSRRTGASAAVMFVDLDDFKDVNDTLGHAAGDLLLQKLTERLTARVRGADTVARLGGDEFVVLLEDVSSAGATRAAEKILASVGRVFDLGGRKARVTASVGVALCPAHDDRREFLLRKADAAMYRAKKGGGNRYTFWSARGDKP